MNKRSGFTLMELLLVVAVLAIVAAAAVPTFFGGAADAMKEARKSRIASAYTNLFSQANMAASVAMAKGETVNPATTANWPTTTAVTLPHPDGVAAHKITLTLVWSNTTGVTITITGSGGGTIPTVADNGLGTGNVIIDLEKLLKSF